MCETVKIPKSNKVGYTELIYWQIQTLPDNIKYTLADSKYFTNNQKRMVKHNTLLGKAGLHATITDNLLMLEKDGKIDAKGVLMVAWLRYHNAVEDSDDPFTDDTVKNALDEFQRLACTASSYNTLLKKAAHVKFWKKKAHVELPRLSRADYLKGDVVKLNAKMPALWVKTLPSGGG